MASAHIADQEPGRFEIVSTRMFAAPRELVFEAFSNPDHLVHWWGQRLHEHVQRVRLRPGGAWRFVMHGPDGVDYQIAKDFVEVVKPERIVLQHLGPVASVSDDDELCGAFGKTELTWCMRFESAPRPRR